MSTNMKAELCVQTLDNAMASYPALHGAIIHSDRGAQYTSDLYRRAITRYGICQSMNSAGGRCHDNARCESMWARMKTELLYDRYDPEQLTVEQLKSLVWRYFMSYWNNRRICSDNGCMMWLLFKFYLSTDIDNITPVPPTSSCSRTVTSSRCRATLAMQPPPS